MTTFEIRRGRHVVASKPDLAIAQAFAAVHSHFPGQLLVWEVVNSERLIEAADVVPIMGARTFRGGRR